MKKVRVHDLTMTFQPDAMLMLRSSSRGVGARVPLPAIGVLAFCSEPRAVEEVAAAMGKTGATLFHGLVDAGLLVDPDQAGHTTVFFENFAAVDIHRPMIGDAVRVEAYARAIQQVVRPGMAVLDAGTGSGLLACMAAHAGARVVYAVERSDLFDLAIEVVARSGLADRVKLIRGDFAEVALPEKVDVIVTETFGALALAEGATADLRTCAERNLAPGGRVVPSGIDLWLAPVGDREVFEDTVEVFGNVHGTDLSALRALALQRGRNMDLTPDALLAPAALWMALKWPEEGKVRGTLTFTDLPEGDLVGLAGWFTLRLAEGVDLPTGPADPVTHWGQTFMPLEPVPIPAGDTLEVTVGLAPAEDDRRGLQSTGTWRLGDGQGGLSHRVR
jgi:precorrin-6B methylase 2